MRPGQSAATRALGRTVGLGALVCAAGLAYAAGVEARSFVLRRVDLAILPAGHEPLRVLHLSDLHLTPGQTKKQNWVRGLGARTTESRPSLAFLRGNGHTSTGDRDAEEEYHAEAIGPEPPGIPKGTWCH